MSSFPYLPGHIIDECRDLRRQGVPLNTLAERLHVAPETLATLLGEPAWRSAEPTVNDECDLWRADTLGGQL